MNCALLRRYLRAPLRRHLRRPLQTLGFESPRLPLSRPLRSPLLRRLLLRRLLLRRLLLRRPICRHRLLQLRQPMRMRLCWRSVRLRLARPLS